MVVRDVIMDVIQMRIVAYFAVMQRSIIYTGMNCQPARQRNLLAEHT